MTTPSPPSTQQGQVPGWPPSALQGRWGYPPHNAFQHTHSARPGRRKVLPLVIAATVLLMVIGVLANMITGKDGALSAFTPSGTVGEPSAPAAATTPSLQAPPPVPATDLDGLLLSRNEVAGATGWATSFATPSPAILDGLNATTAYGRCTVAANVFVQDAYRGSGYKRARSTVINGEQTDDTPAESDWNFHHGLMAFHSAADAAATVDTLQPVWESCNNAVIEASGQIYKLGAATIDDGVLFMSISTLSPAYARRWGCWHAVGARNNILIDLRACAWEATKADAQNPYNAIAAKIDGGG